MKKFVLMAVAISLGVAVGCTSTSGSACKTKAGKTAESVKPAAAAMDTTSYDAATQVLTVTFAKGGTYTYAGVPQDVADKVAQADSKGKAINQLVKGKFEATKVK